MSLPRFSVNNPVLVGVLMVTILGGGIYSGLTLTREMFPESRPNQVLITVVYPGANPEEIERGLALRIEEAIKDVDGLAKIVTTVNEGVLSINAEMDNAVDDIEQAVDDFQAEIDAIPRDELPDEAEEIMVTKFEPLLPVISVNVSGEVGALRLKDVGRDVREELLRLPEITDVVLSGTRKAELTVEVEPEQMVAYDLSLAQIAGAIRQSNLDLPGGQVKTRRENVAVRTLGQTDEAERIAETVLRVGPSGSLVRVADVGRVIDGLEDAEIQGFFDGRPAIDLTVYKTAEQDAINISQQVKAYVAGRSGAALEMDTWTWLLNRVGIETTAQQVYARAARNPFPGDLVIGTHSNLSRYIEDRLELLQRSGTYGLGLVFLSLLLFLNWRVALWVLMGLLVSIAGAIMLMQVVGATLNLITMFGLIVVLGIIVDDAIVVGENIYARFEGGEDPRTAAIEGAEQVKWPVTIAVLTTIGAFAPLLLIEGKIGDFMGVLPVVVMCALSVSLLEALAILPSHLYETLHAKQRRGRDGGRKPAAENRLARLRRRQQRIFSEVLPRHYERLLRLTTRFRYATLACAIGALMIAGGLFFGGHVPFVFIQKMDSETLTANLEMPVGTPVEQTAAAMAEVEKAIEALRPADELANYYTLVGSQLTAGDDGATLRQQSHLATSIVELTTLDERDRTSEEIIAELRAKTADIPGIRALIFETMGGGPSGKEIEIQVTSANTDHLRQAAGQLQNALASYAGVFDIDDDAEEGRREVQIELLDSGRALGLTTEMLATEVRGAFYGLEARTLQREREDVDIRVRFPEERRQNIYELEGLRIATPAGNLVPLTEVARVEEARGYATIRRIDQRRAITVSADVDQSQNTGEKVSASLAPLITELEERYPEMRIAFAGNKLEATKSLGSLKQDFVIALAVIYVMLAGLFKSYVQPLVVLAAVPFGLIGAVTGHLVMGYPMTILSMIGIVALTGIVVNDSLILVDFINHEHRDGKPFYEAVINGGRRRLRPILLTSLTTILGLAPLMMETSFQARFLIPMAISISFGLAFATVLILIVVPALFLVVHDIGTLANRLRGRHPELISLPG
jgi:hydrophobic/amphiphilic exporter-1 (mainly G- bacteria), HAE1 family